MSISLKIDSAEVSAMLEGAADRIGDQLFLSKAGSIVQASVKRNFARGGRPVPWKPLKHRKGRPLRDTGRLMNSITKKISGDAVYVGTNVIYAATHQFGAKKGRYGNISVLVPAHRRKIKSGNVRGKKSGVTFVKSHKRKMAIPWGDVPARPFLMIQDEDIIKIQRVEAQYIEKG